MTPTKREGVGAANPAEAATGTAAIQGFEQAVTDEEAAKNWRPVSDRKIRAGIAGYGVCGFGAAFHFQDHPNVTVAAVADLDPDKCAELAQRCRCETMYSSCEELIGDDSLEAIFVATDAPSHARLAIASLKASDRKYMMFETSYFHDDLHCMQEMYRAGDLGKVICSEGEYWHYFGTPLAAHEGWRTSLPPQWYPTHSNAYYVGVTGGSFTEVSCMGMRSTVEHLKRVFQRCGRKGSAIDQAAAFAAGSRGRWSRWLARLSDERVRGGHTTGPHAACGCCAGFEHDGGRNCSSPVGAEKRGTDEDPTVCSLIRSQSLSNRARSTRRQNAQL
tara:strand:- start:490 stop:1485 length:996 start_codon:yes stop_codon:yes gene_type:complete